MAQIKQWDNEIATKTLKKYIEYHNRYLRDVAEENWALNEATYLSKFYKRFDKSLGALVAEPRQSGYEWTVRTSGNHTFSFVRLLHSKIVSNPPVVAPYAVSNETKDKDAAKAADKIARHQRVALDLDSVISRFVLSTLLYGTGILKIGWNPDDGEVLDSSDNDIICEGNVKLLEVNPRNFYFDQSADIWKDVKWCFHKLVLEKEEAEEYWPDFKGKFEVESNIKSYDPKTMAHEKTRDKVIVYEYYEKAMPSNGMSGRYAVITSGGQLVSLGVLPYAHGMLPFVVFTDIDIPQSVWGMSIIEVLRDPQDNVNKLLSQIIENINTHGVIRLATIGGSGVNADSITNKPYDVIEVEGQPGVAPIQLQPASLPSHMFKFYDMLINIMEHLSGIRGISRGTAPKSLSGFALQFLQEQDEKVLLQLHNKYKRVIVDIYRHILYLVKEFWREKRLISLTNANNDPEVDAFGGSDLEGGFDINYEYGTNLPNDPAAKRQAIMDLIDHGLIEDKKMGLRLLELGEAEGVFDTATPAKQQQKREIAELVSGNDYPVRQRDDHEAHLEILYTYIQTKAYYELPEEIKALVDKHAEAHENILKGKAQAPQGAVAPEQVPPMEGQMPPLPMAGMGNLPPGGMPA